MRPFLCEGRSFNRFADLARKTLQHDASVHCSLNAVQVAVEIRGVLLRSREPPSQELGGVWRTYPFVTSWQFPPNCSGIVRGFVSRVGCAFDPSVSSHARALYPLLRFLRRLYCSLFTLRERICRVLGTDSGKGGKPDE